MSKILPPLPAEAPFQHVSSSLHFHIILVGIIISLASNTCGVGLEDSLDDVRTQIVPHCIAAIIHRLDISLHRESPNATLPGKLGTCSLEMLKAGHFPD